MLVAGQLSVTPSSSGPEPRPVKRVRVEGVALRRTQRADRQNGHHRADGPGWIAGFWVSIRWGRAPAALKPGARIRVDGRRRSRDMDCVEPRRVAGEPGAQRLDERTTGRRVIRSALRS